MPARPMAVLLGGLLLIAGCATTPSTALAPPVLAEAGERAGTPEFAFAADTFAFPNLIRARHPGVDNLYANYCFVLARGLRQFFLYARFAPEESRLTHGVYVERVRAIAARAPWRAPLTVEERVVIPGYANLRDFSRGEEAAVKEGLGGRFWTWIHWTNWRVTYAANGEHQEAVAREVAAEVRAGRLVQLLVTNWPKPELNHTVVAFELREAPGGIEFGVWDPNNPDAPGVLTFDGVHRRFWATQLYDTEPGMIRVFRMYYSWLL